MVSYSYQGPAVYFCGHGVLWSNSPLYIFNLSESDQRDIAVCSSICLHPEDENIHGFTSSTLHTQLMQNIPRKHINITPEFEIICLQVYSLYFESNPCTHSVSSLPLLEGQVAQHHIFSSLFYISSIVQSQSSHV